MKNLANAITLSRMGCAVLLVLAKPFSALFWVWYACGGLSDLLDGIVARKLRQQSAFGAKLDSAADLAFSAAVLHAVFRSVSLPVWVLTGAGMIALLRLAAYGVGYCKFHTFAAIHTLLNKATGFLLFLCPVLFGLFGTGFACGLVCGVGLLAAAEEMIILLRARELNRDQKSLFRLKRM